MTPIKANTLERKYDRAFHGTEKYGRMIEEVRSGKRNYIILDFSSEKELDKGYNSIYQYRKRHGITELYVATRQDGYCNVYRLVLSRERKRRDLLERSDDACRKDENV